MQERLELNQSLVLQIELPLERNGEQMDVEIKAVVATAPSEKKPLDRFFREGMSLPDVRTKNPGELDLILLVEDEQLATYLNFCEGKAHLDLLGSNEIKQKLKKQGYSDTTKVKRIVKNLPKNLRLLFSPDPSEPVADVFVKFFSVPRDKPRGKTPQDYPNPYDSPDIPDLPIPRISPFRVDNLLNGLKIQGNHEYATWPINLTVKLAYADGSRRPAWSEYDFRLENLIVSHEGCLIKTRKNNMIKVVAYGPECRINVNRI